ncbi:MAG: hypothetical protein KBB21_34710 [Nannocystaceae bacterium]|nr:hypothetical protein [Nannocystaceae bacterium]
MMGKPGDGALQVLRTRTELDIEGNALRVIDARGNIAESRTYAMGGLVLEVESEDGG